ncbi:MAG: glycosyltransferase family 61 protein [Synechococcus sp.]
MSPDKAHQSLIREECILVAGWSPIEWGHFVVEFVPRILFLKYCLQRGIVPDAPIYISRITPAFIVEAIGQLLGELSSRIRFFEDKTLTLFERAWIPPFLNFGGQLGYHPVVRALLETELQPPTTLQGYGMDPSKPKLLYVSRQHKYYQSVVLSRSIVNEDEVADVFISRHFEMVAMEEHDLLGKIRILASARVIAGGWGSGLLNTLLSSSSPLVISLGYGFNPAQFHVCDCTLQDYIELPTFDPANKTSPLWLIDGKSQYVNTTLLMNYLDKQLEAI